MLRPATSTLNCGATEATGRPTLKQFLHELDDLGALLEEDFAELLDFALLLDFGVTLELDFTLLLDFGVTLEEDFALELDDVTPELELAETISK